MKKTKYQAIDVPDTVGFFAEYDVHLQVIVDGYETGDLCYRAIVIYKQDDSWEKEDIGAYANVETAWIQAANFANTLI